MYSLPLPIVYSKIPRVGIGHDAAFEFFRTVHCKSGCSTPNNRAQFILIQLPWPSVAEAIHFRELPGPRAKSRGPSPFALRPFSLIIDSNSPRNIFHRYECTIGSRSSEGFQQLFDVATVIAGWSAAADCQSHCHAAFFHDESPFDLFRSLALHAGAALPTVRFLSQ